MTIGGIRRRLSSVRGSIATGGEAPLGRRLLRRAPAAMLVLVPAGPIIAGIVLTSGAVSAAHSASKFEPVKRAAPAAPAPSLPGGSGALVAHIVHPTVLRTAPAGRLLAPLRTRTNFGSPAFLWVVTNRPGWLGVVSPLAGNGRIGWIPQSAAVLTRVPLELHISLSSHRLAVVQGGKVVHQYPVAIGKPSSPTPTGRFDVTDRLSTGDPAGPYGCCVLALSAVAPHAIADWSGGNRVAIHSTPETASIGNSVTHGCVRVSLDNGRWLLGHIPLGTPTVIAA